MQGDKLNDSNLVEKVSTKRGKLSAEIHQKNNSPILLENKNKLNWKNTSSILRELYPDSSKTHANPSKRDTTVIDSTKIDSMAIDSTARLKYFNNHRKDHVYIKFHPPRKSAFFVYPSPRYFFRTVQLDSTGNYVIIKEKIAGQVPKEFLKIPLNQYIKMELKAITQSNWEKLAHKYSLNKNKNDLSSLLSSITNIEIPLPSNSFLSIFGPPRISLRINGSVDIHGAWRNVKTQGVTASLLGNVRNEPDFKQQVQINVNGTIGDKLRIGADWNTERTFEYENQLKIKYTGYKDEIIKSIEAGNVSIQTSRLVGGSDALFGIKAKFQLGPFSLTALASQKKSQVREVSVTGGSKRQSFKIHVYNYSENHYFLDTVYASPTKKIFNDIYGHPSRIIGPLENFYHIKDLEVWKTTTSIINPQKERRANAFLNLPPRDLTPGHFIPYPDSLRSNKITLKNGLNVIGGRFVRLVEGSDYDYDPYAGFITFKTPLQPTDAIAVAYRIEGPAGDVDRYYGEFNREFASDTSKTILLKLVRPPNLDPSFKEAWKLLLKNIYPIGGRDIKKEGFKLSIDYVLPGQDPVDNINGNKLVTVFGLDKTNASGSSDKPDGAFDFLPGQTILPVTGEIVFPVLEPFGRNFPKSLDQSLRYQAVYDTTKVFAQQDKSKDRFIITGQYSASTTSTFNIGFNVVENSVKVFLNGRQLKSGTDYSVDYNIGQVTIRNAAALVPGANLKITYEQNDLFQLASKTLIGLRGIYEFNKETKLGFSFLNLNQQTLSDKVRIGEEPLNNSIYGVDFSTSLNLPFITKGLNNIISTNTNSSFSLRGEFAYMNPDPNTKKSTIGSDKGKSVAYIDDFEGAKRIIPLGVSYTSWHDISVPDQLPYLPSDMSKPDEMSYKAETYWYNRMPSQVNVTQIWGNRKKVARQDQQVTVLDMVYNPLKRGSYNEDPKLGDPKKNWGGIMKYLSTSANNLVEQNIKFIEFWLHIDNAPKNAKLYIDLGQISEDVIPNGILDSEDKNHNFLVDKGEDTGIDGFTDAQERARDTLHLGNDPANDDFHYVPGSGDYERINKTEGNSKLTDAGRLPDTEDLNGNLSLDRLNSYFRYEVSLDSTSKFIAGGGETKFKWYQFKIPLKDFIKKIGNPSFTLIEYIRFWISGVSKPVHLRFAEMNLVGNQWRKVLVPNKVTTGDSVLTVSTINIEDNPNYYSPSGVFRERDRTKPNQQVYKNEQSLDLIIKDLKPGDKREILKDLYRPLYLFNYHKMKLFIHGNTNQEAGSLTHHDSTGWASEVYLKFGSDTLNYYEYREPLKPGWDANNISIDFSELTAIKQARDSANVLFEVPIRGKPGHFYGVRGNPTLTKVSFFIFGVYNLRRDTSNVFAGKVSGDIWLDELRVVNADNTPGWAYNASATLKLADLFTVNFNMGSTDPFFHSLAQRFGKRVDNKNWGVTANLDVMKLIPFNMKGSQFKINYSHTESIFKPLYLPGTDIKVDVAADKEKQKLKSEGIPDKKASKIAKQIISDVQTVRTSDTWSLNNIQLRVPSRKWYINDIINNLTFGFNFNKSRGRSPTILLSSNWVWNTSGKYLLNFSRDNYFYPANIPVFGRLLQIFKDYRNVKVYYTPQSFNTNFSTGRKYNFTQSRPTGSKRVIPKPSIQRDFFAKRSMAFSWKLTEGGLLNLSMNYNVNVASSLAYLLISANGKARKESEIWKDIFNGAFFGRDYSYQQTFSLRTNPRLPTLWQLDRYFQLNAGYSVSYNWRNNFAQAQLGRSAGFANRINLGLTLKLKSLFSPLFNEGSRSSSYYNKYKYNRSRNREARQRIPVKENNVKKGKKSKSVSDTTKSKSHTLKNTLKILKNSIFWMFFNYENVSVTFNQENSQSGSGLAGKKSGFGNFWGLAQKDREAPSRLFMLGLSRNIGPRATNGNLTDNFSQKNTLYFKTQKPLWQGASLNLNWRVGWGINKSTSIKTDDQGNIFITNLTSVGTINKTFLSFPKIFFFNSGIEKVHEVYEKLGGANSNRPDQTLSKAFAQGLESFPILTRIPFFKQFARFIPRPNWRISWSGLERLPFLKKFAKSVSLTHAYSSSFAEGWKINPDGLQEVQTQRISYGFSPLVGINITFKPLLGGNLSGTFNYTTKTSFDLGISTRNITRSFSRDVNLTASFSKSGFKIPLFGISLKNDIEISFSYTNTANSIVVFEMDHFNVNGKPLDGTTRTTLEPRIKYVMSSRVTIALFYKRTSVAPEGASRIPPTTTNVAGLDVHIAIQ